MSKLLHAFQDSLRNNFGSTVFVIVACVIAFFFIGYLIIDYIRAWHETARRKKKFRGDD